MNLSKVMFFCKEISFLGNLSHNSVTVDLLRTKALQELKVPKLSTPKEVRLADF